MTRGLSVQTTQSIEDVTNEQEPRQRFAEERANDPGRPRVENVRGPELPSLLVTAMWQEALCWFPLLLNS